MAELREALESAVNEHDTEPASSTEVATTTPAEVDTSQDESSGEVSTEQQVSSTGTKAEKPSIEDVVEKTDDKQVVEGKTEAKTEPRARIDRAPQSWKGDAKKVWEQLPAQVRQEVARREREITTKLNEVAPIRQRMDQLMEVLAPHQERMSQMYNGNPLTGINNLLNVERTLVSGNAGDKAQLVANMIKKFGIDIATLDELLSGGQMPAPMQQQSELERILEQRLAPVQQYIQSQQQREQQATMQVERDAVSTIEEMASSPDFPYFDDVREDMADLIELSAKKGVALSLGEAYNKAVRMNDGTFQASNTRSTTQAATNAALTAHQEAQRAKGAALSVSGAPSGIGTNFGNPTDLRGTIAAALGNTGGRV